MADNRYRPRSPPGGRRYHDPGRSSASMVYSSSFDPTYPAQPRSAIEPHYSSRQVGGYNARPVKSYTYKDDAYPGGTISRTEYAVRPRNNSNATAENRRPVSMLVKSTSPTRRPVVSNTSRDETRSPMLGPYASRDESARYLVPASSHGREHHQRQYSTTPADLERLNGATRIGGRPRSEYHQSGGHNQKAYTSQATHRPSVKDDDYSYTGPREQFTRDMQSRAPPSRDSYSRRERPMSVYDIPELKAPSTRRDMGPPPAPRPVERIERPDERRLSTRPLFDEPVHIDDLPQRRQSLRAPVVHQVRDEGYSSSRDDTEFRPKSRPPRIEEIEPLPKARPRELDREHDRDREYQRDIERDRDRDLRDRERDRERVRTQDKIKHDDKREVRSRDNSPERSGIGKGIAAGLGGAAVAGIAGAALKGSTKSEDASDSDARKERRHKKHKNRERLEEETELRGVEPFDRRALQPSDERGRDERLPHASKRDDSASESYEDEHQRRRRRRRKHKDREEADTAAEDVTRVAASGSSRADRELGEPEDDDGYRRRSERAVSRSREPEPPELERRTISPGEDEDDRPRRVLLVEPERKEEFRPRGILKAPRTTPFPEDPNPTREGVAPLKEAGKDGVPSGARWTKISRLLVNPEALEKAKERFEERDDYVIVLRVVTREEIQKFAEVTREIREAREKQWQGELEEQKRRGPEHRSHHEGINRRRKGDEDVSSDEDEEDDDDDDRRPQPLLDQKPAVPGLDPRQLIDLSTATPMPGGIPVPDIKLETHDVAASNYSTNV